MSSVLGPSLLKFNETDEAIVSKDCYLSKGKFIRNKAILRKGKPEILRLRVPSLAFFDERQKTKKANTFLCVDQY